MRTAKRTGIAALFAVFFALLLAGCLCLGLPAKREAQAAEGAVSEEEITYNDPLIDGIRTPAELMQAYAAASAGDTITLAGNIQLDMVKDGTITGGDPNGHLGLPKSVTFDLNGNTLNIITGGGFCINIGQTVEGTDKTNATVTIKDGTLIGQSSGHFAIVQAGSTLNLSNVDVQFEKDKGDGQTTRPAAVAVNGRISDVDAAILNVNNVMFSKLENAVPVFVGDPPSDQGTVNFTSDDPLINLRDQINASSEYHKVETELTGNIDGSLVVPEYANITLDLNGYTITNTADKDTITNYGTLTVKDSSENDVGTVTNAGGSKAAIRNYGTAQLRGGTYTRTVAEGATTSYYVIKNVGCMMIGSSTESGVKVTASDEYSSLIANGYYGDADKKAHVDKITVDNACTMIIYDGTFTGGMNVVKNDNEGVLTIHDGEFSTTCNESVLLNANSLTIYGGTFDASKARFAIRNQTGSLEIAKGDFKGEIYAPSQDVEITGGTFDRTFVSSYLAENASFYVKQDGAFVVASEKPADAELIVAGLGAGNAAFTTLQAAIDAYENGIADGTLNENYSISLYSDVTESVTVPVCTDSEGRVYPVSMNMYGHTLTAADGSAAITVEGKFTWVNEGIGTIVGTYGIVVDGGTLDVNKDVVFNCTTDITVKNGGAVTVSAGTFNGTTANFDVQNGTVTLMGGTYSHAIPQSVTLAENYCQIEQDGKYVVAQAIVMIEYTKDAQEVTEGATEWKGALDRIGKLSQEGISAFAVTLLQRVGAGNTTTREETLTIPEGVSLTLDFNGKTANFNIENNGSLILEGTEDGGYYGELTNSGDLLILGGYYRDTYEGAIENNGGTIKVRGGSFGGKEMGAYARNIAQFLDDGYCFTGIGTGSTAYAKVGEAEATASVQDGEGTYYFSTLSNASAYACYHAESESVTIKLLQDVEHGALTLGSASDVKELTLDLGGHTLTYTRFFSGSSYQSSSAIVFGRNGGADEKITVTNGKIVTDKSFDNEKEDRSCFFIVKHNATLILDDVTVSYNGSSAPQNMVYVNQGTLNIKGGEYYGSIGVKGGANAEISGGTFTVRPEDTYLAKGMAVYEVDGKYLVGDQNAVAMLNNATVYTSLQDAIDAAEESGGTVKLLKDVEINEAITIRSTKTLSFDLNGKKITGGDIEILFTISATSVTFGNGTIEAENQVFEITGGTGPTGKTVTFKDDLSISSKNKVAVFIYQSITLNTSAKITAKNAAIMGNGTDTKYAKINVTGGEITSTNAVAMYLPAKSAVVTISGGVVTGTTGIEVRGGTLNIKDGAKIVATGETLDAHREGDGASVLSGAAVAVSKYASSNSLKVNITGGTLKGLYAFYEAELNATQSEVTGLTLSITGGTYNGDIASENVKNFIEGGDFNTVFPSAYLAENAVLVKTTDGFKALGADSEEAKAYVAEVSDPDAETAVRYQTLAAAITAAGESGGTVKLLEDVDTASPLTIDKSVTIDLAGYTISAPATAANITADATIKSSADGGTIKYTGKGSDHGLIVTNDATLTLESVTVDYEGAGQAVKLGTFVDNKPTEKSGNAVLNGVTVKGGQAGVIVLGTQKDSEYGASLTVTNSNISGTIYYGIVNNGMGYNTSITLENTKVSAPVKSGTAMYLPGEGETTITGGTITGATGIEIRAGKLTINEGTKITATGDYEEPVANPSGTTVGGVAVAVSQHTTQLAINVAITGGTFNATGKDGKAFLEIDTVEKEDAEPSEGVTASITGGAFDASVEARNITGFISGTGVKFSKMPKMDYFAENCIAEYNEVTGKYETKAGSWVAAIGEEGYASLQDAINAAENGDTVKLLADVTLTEALTIDKSVTIVLNDKTLTSTNSTSNNFNIEGGTAEDVKISVKIMNGSIVGAFTALNVKNYVELTLEGVELTTALNYGIQLRGDGEQTVNLINSTVTGAAAGVVLFTHIAPTELTVSLYAENSTITGTDGFGISGNGNPGKATTDIQLVNSTVTSNTGTAIYHPQDGTLVVDGGKVTGLNAGIEMRSGSLTVKGGAEITATATEFSIKENGNGTTITGAAIGVSQHSTYLAINVDLQDGTYNGVYAFYEEDIQDPETGAEVALSIKGGAYNGKVESKTVTGFIEGGDFGVKPADKLMNEGYAAEYVNGRYVAVPSTALQEARLAAQADVRAYAAAKGIDWSQIEAAAEDESAVKVLAAYNAIAEAMSTLAVAEAKVAAFDAVDDYDAATGADAKLVAEAIEEIEKAAAASEDQTAVVVPTATYAAIYAAETKAELEYLKDNALAEIKDIRAYRGEIAAQAEELKTLAAAIAAIDGGLFGTEGAQGAIKDIQDAIAAAQEAITNGDKTTSTALKQIYDYLDGTLKSAVDDISKMLNGAVSEGGILYEMQETLEALDATVNGGGTEGPALLEKLNTAIAAAQEAINGNTASEMDEAVKDITEAITAAQDVIIAALPDYEETLGEIAGSVDKLEELLGGTNGLVAIKKGIDDALDAIGTADGETLFEQLAAIESGNTAIKTTVDELAAALTGTDGAIATLTAALTAMQGDITELTGALAEDTGWVAKDIAAAQAEIDKLTAAVGKLGTVDGKDLAAVVGEIADGLEEMDATVNSIASTVSAASAVEEAKTQAAADIRTWLEGYLEELAGDTAQADVLARAAYTAETTEGELYKDISAQFGEENGKLVLKYYNEALAAIDAATTVSDVTTAVATFRAQVASIEASAGNSTDLTVVYVLLGVVLLVLIIACIVALVKGGRQPEPAPAQAAPAEAKPAEAQPEEKEEQAEEAAPAEEPAGEMAPAEEESAAAEDDDKERVVISANVRTFDEAYEDLTDEQRELFNKVKEYALAKEDAVEVKQSGGVVIKRKSKQIVKLTVRRDMPVALFLLENEMLKDFRRNAKSEAKLKVRATELVIREADDLETAYTMVDLSVEQIEKDLEAAKERRREARRQRRLQRQAEEAAAEQAEGAGEPAPAEEPASAESAATDGTDTE